MADEPDESRQEPNLELPSLLGFRRKKRARTSEATAPEEMTEETTGAPAPAAEEPTTMVPPTEPPEVVATPEPEPVPVPEPEPVPEPAPVPDPVPAPAPAPDPVPAPEPVTPPQPVTVSGVEETAVIPGPGTPEAARHEPAPAPPVDAEPVEQEFFQADPVAADAETPARTRPALNLPVVDPRIAVVVTGVVVGLIGMVLASGAGRGCEAVRGVGSCGGLGLLALLVVLAIEIVIGGALLRAARVTDPASTAFLGVGMMAVIALLFLLGSLQAGWMFVVLPIITGVTFLASWWVTETFVEGGGD